MDQKGGELFYILQYLKFKPKGGLSMYQVQKDLSIYITRGDMAVLAVTAENQGKPYIFQQGDLVRLKVFEKKNCDTVVLQKDIPVTETTDTVQLYLSQEDTRLGKLSSKPVDYWYEVELNPMTAPQTIIGYDENGPKILRVFPEGGDRKENT